jgi:hygromycin-B 7''-O-kinase
MHLPHCPDAAAFDTLHDNAPAWHGAVATIAARHSAAPVRQMLDGTVLVALVGQDLVVKLYPPFLRDHFDFEAAALRHLQGRLSVPTPELIASDAYAGWPYLVMSQLQGHVLTGIWPALTEAQRCDVLHQLGALVAQVHALPVAPMLPLAPTWPDFLRQQRARCHARHTRNGVPAQLLSQLEDFLQGDLPAGPAVMLTGEYTPMNLLVQGPALVGLFDFGDGLVGPREYDWLGPLCFLAAGHAARCDAFFSGYGVNVSPAQRLALLRLLLLHRYSNLPAQIQWPGWQQARSFEALALLIWP